MIIKEKYPRPSVAEPLQNFILGGEKFGLEKGKPSERKGRKATDPKGWLSYRKTNEKSKFFSVGGFIYSIA